MLMSIPPSAHCVAFSFFFSRATATTEIYTLSLHDALPIFHITDQQDGDQCASKASHKPLSTTGGDLRSEEHTSELQSRPHLVCRLLLEKKNLPLEAHPPRDDDAAARQQGIGDPSHLQSSQP